MTTMTRTDIHRPSASEFDPENYEVFDFADFHDTEGYRPVKTVSRLVSEGWSFRGAPHGSGQCSHCGAHLRYAALMGHVPTKTLLYVGETCLDNRFEATAAEFQAMRKRAAAKAEQTRREGKSTQFFAQHPDLVDLTYVHNIAVAGGVEVFIDYDWNEFGTKEEAIASSEARYGASSFKAGQGYSINYKRGTTWEEQTRTGKWTGILSDMAGKVERYGDLSEKQVDFARKMLGWLAEAEVKRSERGVAQAAKVEAGAVVPTGRVVIEGEVSKTDVKYNDYGSRIVMTVVLDNGSKVWGTMPSSIDASQGDRVRFTATVEAKADDPTFGFFKRPAKAEVL